MNYNTIVCYDVETSGLDHEKHEIVQIAAVAINSKNLTIIPNSEFNSLIRPLTPETADPKALEINGHSLEKLSTAPLPQTVWADFALYVERFNYKPGQAWTRPIPAGHNIVNFDSKFINKMCQKYGPWNKERGEAALFYFIPYDTLFLANYFFENSKAVPNLKLGTLKDYMKIESIGNLHDALVDV